MITKMVPIGAAQSPAATFNLPGLPGHPGLMRGPDQPLKRSFQSMASEINLWVSRPTDRASRAVELAEFAIGNVARSCTRFDPESSLMQANAAGDQWYTVTDECYRAIALAAQAHAETGGRFDPRVLRTLQSQGYDRTLDFDTGPVVIESPSSASTAAPTEAAEASSQPWKPGLDPAKRAVRIGPIPIDLGGIGKGFAVRLAAQQLLGAGESALVEAGGDCAAIGSGPDGTGWRIGIEDPTGKPEPVAVLALHDQACATSSIRLRKWKVDGRTVHHLIDPRTHKPGGAGLLSVTVVASDPAWAEVWSKSLFLANADGIRELAEARDLAALWVFEDSRQGHSRAMAEYLLWERSDV